MSFAATASGKPESDASWTSFGHDQQLTVFSDAPAFTAQVKGFTLAWKAAPSGAALVRSHRQRNATPAVIAGDLVADAGAGSGGFAVQRAPPSRP